MPIGKVILTTITTVIIIAIYVTVSMLLKLKNIWIPFMGLCVWSVMGMKIDMKEMSKVWLGGAVALIIALLLGWAPKQFGMMGLAIPAGLILLFMFCMVSNKLSIVFNMSTGIFLTAATAIPTGIHYSCFYDLAYGIVTLWILPIVVVKVMASKSSKEVTLDK